MPREMFRSSSVLSSPVCHPPFNLAERPHRLAARSHSLFPSTRNTICVRLRDRKRSAVHRPPYQSHSSVIISSFSNSLRFQARKTNTSTRRPSLIICGSFSPLPPLAPGVWSDHDHRLWWPKTNADVATARKIVRTPPLSVPTIRPAPDAIAAPADRFGPAIRGAHYNTHPVQSQSSTMARARPPMFSPILRAPTAQNRRYLRVFYCIIQWAPSYAGARQSPVRKERRAPVFGHSKWAKNPRPEGINKGFSFPRA